MRKEDKQQSVSVVCCVKVLRFLFLGFGDFANVTIVLGSHAYAFALKGLGISRLLRSHVMMSLCPFAFALFLIKPCKTLLINTP